MKKSKQKQREPAYISHYDTVQSQQMNCSESVEVEYEIQQILQHRIKQKQRVELRAVQTSDREIPLEQLKDEDLEYLVKWVGYQELSWEPAQNLKNAPQIVEKYKRQNKPSNNKKIRPQARQNASSTNQDSQTKLSLHNRENKQIKARKYFNFSKVFPSQIQVKKSSEDSELVEINESTFAEQVFKIKNQQESLESSQKLFLKDRKIRSSLLRKKNEIRKKPMDKEQLNSQKLKEIQLQMGNFKERKFSFGLNQYSDVSKKHRQPYSNTSEESYTQTKRMLSWVDPLQILEPKTVKRVKPNEPILQNNRVIQELEYSSVIISINVDDDMFVPQSQPEVTNTDDQLNFFPSNQTKTLAQRIKDQILSLEEDSLALQQISLKPWAPVKLLAQPFGQYYLSYQFPKNEIYAKNECLVQQKTSICADCLIWREKSEQLNRLYNQQLSGEINFDSLFLQQGILQIMNKSNPKFEMRESKQVRLQKLLDISQNKLLCKLILKKMVRFTDLNGLMQEYSISKFVKIDSVWFAILKVKDCIRGSAFDHFKYVVAETLLSTCRDSIVEFLTR